MSPRRIVILSTGSVSIFLAIVANSGAEYVIDLSLHSLGYILSESATDSPWLMLIKLVPLSSLTGFLSILLTDFDLL